MLKLGVNIDHVATVREARYRGLENGEPDPVEAAMLCVDAGAHGITAHLREDRRHIQDRDIFLLRRALKVRFNFEMANTPEIVGIALRVKPDVVCIVPERREEVTTEGGMDVRQYLASLTETRKRLNDAGVEVSLFVTPELNQIEASAKTGSQFVELHTGAMAEAHRRGEGVDDEVERLVEASHAAAQSGLRVNAGHGLNLRNLPRLFAVPHLEELNIGHSIVSRSVMAGLACAVQETLELMREYPE